MILGIDQFIDRTELHKDLAGSRLAFLGHAASINSAGIHSLDSLMKLKALQATCAFGPQHGMRSEKQDNMIESNNYMDPVHGIPVFSLYGDVRRPTEEMTDQFDILLVDLQDIGARVYTYSTTLFYMLEACTEHSRKVILLDRPNPAGRAVEGTLPEKGWESFIGDAPLIMRHGLTIGEMAHWYIRLKNLDIDFRLVEMQGYHPLTGPGYGWPVFDLPWVNPSPNASGLNMARCFPGTALIEGTNLSEGRGTTTPLEILGAPDLNIRNVLKETKRLAPAWMQGCLIRPCSFEPAYDKYQNKLCSGMQIHTDYSGYDPERFKPYRLVAAILKAIRNLYPEYDMWRTGPFEYETDKRPIDLLSGGPFLREWVDDANATAGDLEARLQQDENRWLEQREAFIVYPE